MLSSPTVKTKKLSDKVHEYITTGLTFAANAKQLHEVFLKLQTECKDEDQALVDDAVKVFQQLQKIPADILAIYNTETEQFILPGLHTGEVVYKNKDQLEEKDLYYICMHIRDFYRRKGVHRLDTDEPENAALFLTSCAWVTLNSNKLAMLSNIVLNQVQLSPEEKKALQHYLITPVQRLPRIEMFFSDVLKYSNPGMRSFYIIHEPQDEMDCPTLPPDVFQAYFLIKKDDKYYIKTVYRRSSDPSQFAFISAYYDEETYSNLLEKFGVDTNTLLVKENVPICVREKLSFKELRTICPDGPTDEDSKIAELAESILIKIQSVCQSANYYTKQSADMHDYQKKIYFSLANLQANIEISMSRTTIGGEIPTMPSRATSSKNIHSIINDALLRRDLNHDEEVTSLHDKEMKVAADNAVALCKRLINNFEKYTNKIIKILQNNDNHIDSEQLKKIEGIFYNAEQASDWYKEIAMKKSSIINRNELDQQLERILKQFKDNLIRLGLDTSESSLDKMITIEEIGRFVVRQLNKINPTKDTKKEEGDWFSRQFSKITDHFLMITGQKEPTVEAQVEIKRTVISDTSFQESDDVKDKGKDKETDVEKNDDVAIVPEENTSARSTNLLQYVREEYDPSSAIQDDLAELLQDDIGSDEAVNCDVVAMTSPPLRERAAFIRIQIEKAGIDELLCVNTQTKQRVYVGCGEDLLAAKNMKRTEHLLAQARKVIGIDRVNDDKDPFADCDFISMSLPPLKQDAAYVRVQIQDANIDTLLYVNKVNRAYKEIDIKPALLKLFDEIIKPSEEVKTLTDNQLKKINRITKHPHVNINKAEAHLDYLTDAQMIAKENAKKRWLLQYGVVVQNSTTIAFGTSFAAWGGSLGAVIGASLGFVAGVFLSPFTLGASIPTCMLIGAGAGAVVGGSTGLLVGATAGAIEDEELEDERTARITAYNNEISWTGRIIEKLKPKVADNLAIDLEYPEPTESALPNLDDWSSKETKPTRSWLSMFSIFNCGCSKSMSRSPSFEDSPTLSIDEYDHSGAQPMNPGPK